MRQVGPRRGAAGMPGMQRRPQPFNLPIPNQGNMITPQGKIGMVTDKLGVPGVTKMQGTTVTKYDSLAVLTGRQTYAFFKEAQTRPFPLSNVGTDGGRLGVGESLVIQRISFALMTFNGTQVTQINPLAKNSAGLVDGELTINVGNQDILLRWPISNCLPEYNKDAENAVNVSYEFDTMLVIPPEINYVLSVQVSGAATVADLYLRCTIEGVGSVFNAQQTY